MSEYSDAYEAELLEKQPSSQGASSARKKKNKISQQDENVITLDNEFSTGYAGSPRSYTQKNNENSLRSASNGNIQQPGEDENSAFDLDISDDGPDGADILDAEIDAQPQEAELVDSFDDSFDDMDDNVIDIESNLPALSGPRLPSVNVRDNLQSYLREVSRFPLLDPEEETALARRVRDYGDSEAAFRIISSHLRLVVRIAMDFQRRWMQNVLDLIQEGNVGLLRAVNKFDPDKGIKFSYYASFWIKAYILKFIMDNWRMVKIGTTQAQRKLFYNLNRERQKLILQGFDPDSALLSQRLGVTQDQVIEMQQRLDAGDVSLDVPVSDESGSASRMDFLPALGPGLEEDIAGNEIARLVRDSIEEMLPSLSEKEIYILENRLLTDEPATLREIGERYNVTRERIRQLEARLLEKLKEHLGREIRDFSEDWINN